jgi:hypothetical protein
MTISSGNIFYWLQAKPESTFVCNCSISIKYVCTKTYSSKHLFRFSVKRNTCGDALRLKFTTDFNRFTCLYRKTEKLLKPRFHSITVFTADEFPPKILIIKIVHTWFKHSDDWQLKKEV